MAQRLEEADGHVRTAAASNRARRERKGTPQGAPISPLFSNVYMRRFILGWKVMGYARRFEAEIVNYAARLCATKARKGGRDGHLAAAMLHEG